MNRYLQMKEKLLSVFGNRNIGCSFEELIENEFRIIDFNSLGHEYKGRAFVLKYEENRAYGLIRFNNNREDLQIDFDESEIDKYFLIETESKVGFLPVDGKGTIVGNNESCCDFIYFDSNLFFFCEFKVNAKTENYLSIKQIRNQAISQLEKTIVFFEEKINNFCGLEIQANLISPPHFPKFNPDVQQMQVSFLERNGIQLYEKYI